MLLSLAQSLSLCTINLPGAVCHANMIPVSGHPSTYLATRCGLCQSLTLGLDIALEHILSLYIWPVHRPVVQPGHCASVQTCVVRIQHMTHRCFLTLALKSPHRLSSTLSHVLTINVDHRLRMLQIQCFDNSPTVSFFQDVRDPVVLPDDFPVLHDQRFTKITARPHHGVLRLEVLVHDALQTFQLVPGFACSVRTTILIIITISELFLCPSCPNHAAWCHSAVATVDITSFTTSRGGVAEKFLKPSILDPWRNSCATSLLLCIPLFSKVSPNLTLMGSLSVLCLTTKYGTRSKTFILFRCSTSN